MKKQIPEIGKDVENLFKKVTPDKKFSSLLQDVYTSKDFKGTPFKEFVDGMDSVTKRTITAGDALSQYKTHLKSVGETTSFASKTISGLKKVGSVLASMGTTFAAMWAISAAFKALDDYTHQYSRSLEEASKASGEYETQKNHVQQLTSEYTLATDLLFQKLAMDKIGK